MSFLSRFKNPSTQQLKLFDNKSLAFFKRKKVLFVTIILLIFAGVFCFVCWQNQKDVRELNKNLPAGIKVIKSFIGKDYKVVNKIDGYEFKVPQEWKEIKEIKYYPEEEKNEGITGLSLEGVEGKEKSLGIISYRLNETSIDLEKWVRERFQKFKLSEVVKIEKINPEVVKVSAEEYLADFNWYFLKNGIKIYEISGISEELAQEIITNGQWGEVNSP